MFGRGRLLGLMLKYRSLKLRKAIRIMFPLMVLVLITGWFLSQSTAAGIVEWNVPDGGGPWELVADDNNDIWFVKSFGNKGVCKLDPDTGYFEFYTSTEISAPWGISVGSGHVYFTDNNKIYKIDGKNFYIFKLEPSYVNQLRGIYVDVKNNYIWFASYGDRRIGLLNLTKSSSPYNVTYWTLPEKYTPSSLVYDERTGLWFTDDGMDTIGNIPKVTSDTISFYRLDSGSDPIDIDTDLSGNIWFTESGRNRIGKVNPTLNELTEYDIPVRDSRPHGIVIDYSNRVWVALSEANAIAVFNPLLNTFSIYNRALPGMTAYIATSKDRKTPIFFTDPVGKIGKIDPGIEVTTVFRETVSSVSTYMKIGSSTTILAKDKTTGLFSDVQLPDSLSVETTVQRGTSTTYAVPETVTLLREVTSELTTYYVTQTATTSTLITVTGTTTSYITTTTATLTLYGTTYKTVTSYMSTRETEATGVLIVPGYTLSSIFLGLMAGLTVLLCGSFLKKRLTRLKASDA
jgi:virginiamycin B lyase